MLLFADSFSHYTQEFMDQMWDVVSVPFGFNPADPSQLVTLTQGLTIGRFGAGGVAFDAPDRVTLDSDDQLNDSQYIQKNYDGVSVIHQGLAVLQTATQIGSSSSGGTSAGGRLLTLLDGATTQVGIDIMPSGQLQAVRSTLPGTGIYLCSIGTTLAPQTYTVLGLSSSAISSNAYDVLQVKVTHATSGSIEIRRGDGSLFWLLEGVPTNISGNNQSASMLIGGYGAVFTANRETIQAHYLRAIVSDVHLLNTTVNPDDPLDPVTFIGDRHWQVLVPTTDGNYKQWTPDPTDPGDPAEHAQNVNTIPPNEARNNNTSTVGNIDSFNTDTPNGPADASVLIAYTMYLEKDTGGATGVRGLFRLSGSDRTGTEFQAPSPLAFKQSMLASKPGGGAITVADFGAGEHGYKLSS